MLKDKIAAVELQMKAKLNEIRATFAQSGDKGSSVEDSFREFLRQYLPRRLEIGQGEIIDSSGERSKQTDVVIVNEEHPFTFTPELPGLFFIEGVCAAGEVKTVLKSQQLDVVLENSYQFKRLKIEAGKGTMIHANPSDIKRFYERPPWFLVAFESQLTLPSILTEIDRFVNRTRGQADRLVDAVFILDRGWLINFGDGEGSFQSRTPEGKSVGGWVWKESNSVLFDLLGWLSIVMPRMIRFEPVLTQYIVSSKSRSLKKDRRLYTSR